MRAHVVQPSCGTARPNRMSNGMPVTLMKTARIGTGLAATGMLLAACANTQPAANPSPTHFSSSRPSPTPAAVLTSQSSSPTPSHQASIPSRSEVLLAVGTVREYLHAWVNEGPTRASRYLVASERVPSDQGAPRISAGTVESYRLDSWKGPRQFTLFVSMNLTFATDPMAWNRGNNGRFVTVYPVGDHKYLLEFATSP